VKSLYDILGIGKKATPREVKNAYRRAARETHPDRGGSNEAFFAVNHAYQVLTDERKRKIYDQTGDDSDLGDQRARMLEELGRLVYGIIENTPDVANGNVIEVCRRSIAAATTAHKQTIELLRQKIKKAKKAVKRITRKDGGVNSLAALIEPQIRSHEVGIIQAEAAIARNEIMLDLLGSYDYRTESFPQPGERAQTRESFENSQRSRESEYEAANRQREWEAVQRARAARESLETYARARAKESLGRAQPIRPTGTRKPVEVPPPPPPEPPDVFNREIEL
jgi:curved DNA-binding protein CbpA